MNVVKLLDCMSGAKELLCKIFVRGKREAPYSEKEWGLGIGKRTEREEGRNSGADIKDLRSYFHNSSFHSTYEY